MVQPRDVVQASRLGRFFCPVMAGKSQHAFVKAWPPNLRAQAPPVQWVLHGDGGIARWSFSLPNSANVYTSTLREFDSPNF